MEVHQKCTARVVRLTVLAVALLCCGKLPRALAGTPAAGFTDTPYATGLNQPTAIAFLPDGRMVTLEKGGDVRLFTGGSGTLTGTVPVCTDSEMGLLGIAVDPAFSSNHYLYLYRTEPDGGCGSASGRSNEIVRTTLVSDTLGALTPLLTGIRTDGGNHDGGVLRISPGDGKLYIGVGDTGVGDGGSPGSSTNPYAQDPNALEGKILRLNLDGTIPSDNPYVGQAGKRGEIFALGLRNPFRMGFDPLNGRLWVGDVGQGTVEEIDLVVRGGNYSWPYCEGSQPTSCAQVGDGLPVYEYLHSGSASVTGGAFAVGGSALGSYYFADFVVGTIWGVSLNSTRDGFAGAPAAIVTSAGGPTDLVFGPDGALYYVSYFSGTVRRVTEAGFGPSTTTTTTSTASTSTTSTTLPMAGCSDTPTYACVAAELDDLAAVVASLQEVGGMANALGARLERAQSQVGIATEQSQQGRTRPAAVAGRRAMRALVTFRQRLRLRAARSIDEDTRKSLFAAATDALVALRQLVTGS